MALICSIFSSTFLKLDLISSDAVFNSSENSMTSDMSTLCFTYQPSFNLIIRIGKGHILCTFAYLLVYSMYQKDLNSYTHFYISTTSITAFEFDKYSSLLLHPVSFNIIDELPVFYLRLSIVILHHTRHYHWFYI